MQSNTWYREPLNWRGYAPQQILPSRLFFRFLFGIHYLIASSRFNIYVFNQIYPIFFVFSSKKRRMTFNFHTFFQFSLCATSKFWTWYNFCIFLNENRNTFFFFRWCIRDCYILPTTPQYWHFVQNTKLTGKLWVTIQNRACEISIKHGRRGERTLKLPNTLNNEVTAESSMTHAKASRNRKLIARRG